MVICFIILTDLTKVLLSFVWLKFSSFGEIKMDEGIRSDNSLILGMPMHANEIFKEYQETKLWDAPEGIPTFF